MCLLVIEIVLLIAGLISLITGKINLLGKPSHGPMARLAGLTLMLPLPLSFGAGLILGIILVGSGKAAPDGNFRLIAAAIEIGILVVCVLISIVFASMATKGEPKRRRMVDDDDDFDRPRDDDRWSDARKDFDDGGRGPDDDRFRA